MTVAEPRAAAATGRCLGVGVLATILLGACGLPFSSTLSSPSLDCQQEDVPGVLSFCGSSTQLPFLGYEIYYIIVGATEGTPDALHHQDLEPGFGRLSRSGSEPCDSDRLPLVGATDAGPDHTVSLDVTALRDSTASATSDAEPYLRLSWRPEQRHTVRRDKGDEFGRCMRFSALEEYDGEDSDISAAAASTLAEGGLIELVAYAVSYGRDRGQPLYSAPLLIGRVELDLPFR